VGSVEALARTFIVSGIFVGLDLILKVYPRKYSLNDSFSGASRSAAGEHSDRKAKVLCFKKEKTS